MENESSFEPLFEFEAPKYVDLRYALSEEGYNDGADEWFDQMRRNASSFERNDHLALRGLENTTREERKTLKGLNLNPQKPTDNFTTNYEMLTDKTQQLEHSDIVVSKKDESNMDKTVDHVTSENNVKQILAEATNQLNLVSLKSQDHLPRCKCGEVHRHSSRCSNITKPAKGSVSSLDETGCMENPSRKDTVFRITSNEKDKQIAEERIAKRVPVRYPKNKDSQKTQGKNVTKTSSGNLRDSLSRNVVVNTNNKMTQRQENGNKRISSSQTTQAQSPKFLTEERASRYRERLEKLRAQSKTFTEPKTPKEYGKEWKPIPTRAKTPHFRSDSRLRHCVEKTLLQRQKQNLTSHSQEIPRVTIFGQHTARRAEVYKQQKNVLSEEEKELRRIEDERRKLRDVIMKSRENFQRALNAPIVATNSVQIRKSTVPKEFHFFTQGRSNRSILSKEMGSPSLLKVPRRNL